MTLPERVYTLLLRAYPSRYRKAHQRELQSTLRDVLGSPPRLEVREVAGLVRGGLGQRLSATGRLKDRHVRAMAVFVLVVGLASSLLQHSLWPTSVPAGAGPASFAPRSPAYSHRTADVGTAPLGRAVALYQHGTGVEWRDDPQALALAADRTATRRLSLALDRAGPRAQGDPAPMLLSSDGRSVAVGAFDEVADELAVVDLTDGAVREVPVPRANDIRPLAWSSDSEHLAFTAGRALFVLDLRSGTARRLPQGTGALGAAFSPAADELAVDTGTTASRRLLVLSLDGALQRTLTVPVTAQPVGPGAWSPDGRLLAFDAGATLATRLSAARDDGVHFLSADGEAGTAPPVLHVPHPGEGYHGHFAGWSSAERIVLMTGPGTGGAGGDAALIETDLAGRAERVLTTIPTNDGNEAVWRVQLASALLPGHSSRPQTDSDTGPWPLSFAALLSAAAAIAAWVLAHLGTDVVALAVRRRRAALLRQLSGPTASS